MSKESGHLHWVRQRVSALLLIPLTLWIIGWLKVHGPNPELIVNDFKSPWIVFMFLFWLSFAFWHAYLGLSVVIQDYVPRPFLRLFVSYLVKLTILSSWLFSVIIVLNLMLQPTTSLTIPPIQEESDELTVLSVY